MKRFASLLLSIFLALLAGGAMAATKSCVSPGDTLDMKYPPSLKGQTLNLVMQIDTDLYPVTLISTTTTRIRVRVTPDPLPFDARFKIVNDTRGGARTVLATGVTCGDPTAPEPTPPVVKPPKPPKPKKPATAKSLLQSGKSRPTVRATRDEVAAPSGEPEYLLVGKADAMARAQIYLSRQGVRILRATSLGSLGVRMVAVDLNGRMSINETRSSLAQQRIAVTIGKHTVYRAAAGRESYASSLVGLPPAQGCQLKRAIRVGLIDGPVDSASPALNGVVVSSKSVLGARERIGSSDHATGIAALIGGRGTQSLPPGLSPGAQIFSVVAFAKNGGQDVARLENIAEALDWMIARKVDVVNMSLAGPYNETLEDIVEIAAKNGVIMVAAAGNGGRAEVSYPASDPRVIAVTAVDAAGRAYRRANYGPEIEFAAPGVDILLPNSRGTAYRSGTSYAAAIATAIIAQELSKRSMGQAQLVNILRSRSKDLGAPGRDAHFGNGLIQASPCK